MISDINFAQNIHNIAELALLPSDSVVTSFELLFKEVDEKYDNVPVYFEETYIGKW